MDYRRSTLSLSILTALFCAGTAMAQDAWGFGGPPFTSTRHIRQLPATDSRSW